MKGNNLEDTELGRVYGTLEAADFAVELAAEHRAELIFVHVVATLDLVADEGYDVDFALPHEPSQHDRSVLDNAAVAERARPSAVVVRE